jgi:hypothetical protein
MLYVRWITGTLLVAFFLLWIVCNLVYVYGWCVHRKHSSLVIIVGGIAGVAGFLILPIKALNDWFWIPIAADIAVPYGAALVLLAGRKLLRR